VHVKGSGFPADVDVALELHSDPINLGVVHTDASGRFDVTVLIPPGVVGSHRVVASWANGSAAASVEAPIALAGPPPSSLAFTGTDSRPLVVIALMLVLFGAVLVLRRRRV
jgi:LPXTG-motif cell wall-anchored protein